MWNTDGEPSQTKQKLPTQFKIDAGDGVIAQHPFNVLHQFASELDQQPLQGIVQLVSDILVLCVVGNPGIRRDHSVLGSDVDSVVDLPVHVSNLACWMEKTLPQRRKHPYCSLKSISTFNHFLNPVKYEWHYPDYLL